jgi:hypothetical protein
MKRCESGMMEVFGMLQEGADPAEQDSNMKKEAV